MVAAAQAAGEPVPTGALEAMDVWPVALPYRVAWQVLSDGRRWAMGDGALHPGGLAYTELVAYARDHGLATTRTALEEFVVLVLAQDAVWLAWYAATYLTSPAGGRRPRGG